MSEVKYYRCPRHAHIPAHNSAARANPELDEQNAECAACIMEEVWYLRNVQGMDLLDTIARLLRLHAQAREKIDTLSLQMRLLKGEPNRES